MHFAFFLSLLLQFLHDVEARKMYQSQCVFRHGARAPTSYVIPPYDEVYMNLFHASAAQLTTPGFDQLRAFGKYLSEKYSSNDAFFYSGEYYKDWEYVAASSTTIDRTFQSVQSLFSELYPDENSYIPVWTVEVDYDVIRNHKTCLNYGTDADFQYILSVDYANSVIDEDSKNELFSIIEDVMLAVFGVSCDDIGILCYLLLNDHLESLTFHFANNTEYGNWTNTTVYQSIKPYKDKFDLIVRDYLFAPYIRAPNGNNGQSGVGFELFNEIVNHLNCNFINFNNSNGTFECINGNNQDFEQTCDARYCGVVLYSAHDATVRMLAHQLGVLTEDNIFNQPPYATSICFDLYLENDGRQTVDILVGKPIKNESAEFGFTYVQEYVSHASNISETSTMATSFLDSCDGFECDIDDILEYRDSRIPQGFGCCTLDETSLAYYSFNVQGCSNYEMTNNEIKELNGDSDTCDLWRKLCPSTACGNNSTDYVYSPYFEKCISTTYENPSISTTTTTTTIGHADETTSSSNSVNIVDTSTTIMNETQAQEQTATNTNSNSDLNPDSNSSNKDNDHDDDVDVSFIVICVCITVIVCCGMTLIFVYKYFTYKLKLVSKSNNSKQNEQEMAQTGSNDKNNNKNNTNGDDTTAEPRVHLKRSEDGIGSYQSV